ncbi:hypothetical protein D9M72_482750 [compost metagenome]
MVQVLRHQHLCQQAGSGHSLVDDVSRHRRLGDLLAAPAHPLAADVALDREHARLVVQLLCDVLADPLQRLAAPAGGVRGLVVDLTARQVRGQLLSLGLLLLSRGRLRCLQRLDLRRDGGQIGVQRLLEQALLLGVVSLALGGELQSLEDRVLVRELVDDRLLERQLRVSLAQPLAKLLRVQRVDVVGDHGH